MLTVAMASPRSGRCGVASAAGWRLRRPVPRPLVIASDALEELDEVAGRVGDDDLANADTCDDLVAQVVATRSQRRDRRLEIRDLDGDAVPTSRFGQCSRERMGL